jgi:transposase
MLLGILLVDYRFRGSWRHDLPVQGKYAEHRDVTRRIPSLATQCCTGSGARLRGSDEPHCCRCWARHVRFGQRVRLSDGAAVIICLLEGLPNIMLGSVKRHDLDHPVLVSLDALVPANHIYRRLDGLLDLSFVRDWVKDRYADSGRPSIDPVVFFKLQLILYLEGLRSERQLMRLAADRLSVRWYVGYGLDETLPDHSSLTRIRERYGLEIFRRFFDAVIERCVEAGLVWGKEFYIDATKVQANASLDSVKPRFAVDEHLRNLFEATEDKAQRDIPRRENETRGHEELSAQEDEPLQLPVNPPSGLAEQNASRHDWIAEGGQQQRDMQHGSYRRVADFQMSTTDRDATLMRARRGGALQLGYHDHYLTDGGRERIILSVLVTASEVMENQVMLDLLWHTCFRWKLRPDQVAADTTYGTIENIIPIEDAGIAMYTPLPDWDARTPYYGPSRFTYDPGTDTYHCPNGQLLRRDHAKYTEGKIVYQAAAGTCDACALRSQCTSSKEGRRIHRSIDEDYLDRVRAHHETKAYEKAMRKRKLWTEPLFAEAKLWHGLRRFRLRRLWRVNIEALMIAAAQNLKRLLRSRGRSPKPVSGMAVPVPFIGKDRSLIVRIVAWIVVLARWRAWPRPDSVASVRVLTTLASAFSTNSHDCRNAGAG